MNLEAELARLAVEVIPGDRVETDLVQFAQTQIFFPRGNRFAVIFAAPAGNNIWVYDRGNVAPGVGFKLKTTGEVQIFDFRRYGSLVTGSWFARGEDISNAFVAIELVIDSISEDGPR